MRKLIFYFCLLIIFSCGEEEAIENTNNNIPPNPPSLIVPSNSSTVIHYGYDDPVYFEWSVASDPDNDVTAYEWNIDDNPNFSSPSYYTMEANHTYANTNQYSTPRPYLDDNQTYYWKVRTRDSNYNYSNFSQTYSFYLEDGNAPSAPQLVFPLHETECSNDNLTFDWYASNDPSGNDIDYKLYISTSPSFDSNVDIYTTSNTLYNVGLPQSTALYWKVEAINSNNSSSFSETRSLYTQGAGTTNTIPQIEYTSPENEAIITSDSIHLQWTASDNETNLNNLSFKIYFSEVGQNLELIDEDTDLDIYLINNLNSNTTYQWSIWVTDEDGATNVGEVYTFSVN